VWTLLSTLAGLPPSAKLEPPAMIQLQKAAEKYLDALNTILGDAEDMKNQRLMRVGVAFKFYEVCSLRMNFTKLRFVREVFYCFQGSQFG
jgi:hypothetical protein